MVSNAAQLILDEATAKGCNLHDLADYAVIQINDTHPSMVIPELIRLLTERGIEFEEACEIVSHVCAYTNHTILAEALEKWPISYLEEVVPHLMPIIRKAGRAYQSKISAGKSCHHRQERPGTHGTYGHTLRIFHQRCCIPSYRYPEGDRASSVL